MVSVPNSPLTLPLRGEGMWGASQEEFRVPSSGFRVSSSQFQARISPLPTPLPSGERVWMRGYFNFAIGEAQAFAPAFGGGIHCGTCSLP